MLLSHLLILSLVCVTINGQVRRTFTCSRNPDAGATTPKADAPTTNVGATTKAGTTTTQAGTTTNQAGATTNQAGATTNQAEATTTNVEANTTQAGATTNQAGATTNQAGATTNQAGATTNQAGATTNNVEANTTQAGATTNKAGATTNQAEATTNKAGATTNKADAPTTNVGATTTNVGATTTKAGATSNQAGATTNKAEATTTNVEATTTKASTNYNGACSNMSIIDGRLPNCTAIYRAGCEKSGIYKITPNGWTEGPFEAYCDMETTDPNWNKCTKRGWTVFQRRVNGSVDFNRNWASYKDGFGQLDHEFCLGNEKLLYLTKEDRKHRLRINLVSNSGTTYHACYEEFHIKEEGDKYEFHVSGFHGTNSLSDGLSDQNGKAFSTTDMDNTESNNNCADITQGGWWHETCDGDYTNLNGVYGSTYSLERSYQKRNHRIL